MPLAAALAACAAFHGPAGKGCGHHLEVLLVLGLKLQVAVQEQEAALAGLLAGLIWAGSIGATTLLTLPGDMPFLPANLWNVLLPAPRAPMAAGRRQYLVATWPVTCQDSLRRFLESGASRRVQDFAATINMDYVDGGLWPTRAFDNINTPEDLANARATPSAP
jgi:molybdopterin-guanine dinucleotide biosynthesis protein A